MIGAADLEHGDEVGDVGLVLDLIQDGVRGAADCVMV
jgi:hypothetical protein